MSLVGVQSLIGSHEGNHSYHGTVGVDKTVKGATNPGGKRILLGTQNRSPKSVHRSPKKRFCHPQCIVSNTDICNLSEQSFYLSNSVFTLRTFPLIIAMKILVQIHRLENLSKFIQMNLHLCWVVQNSYEPAAWVARVEKALLIIRASYAMNIEQSKTQLTQNYCEYIL